MLREICQSLISYLFRLDITILDKTEAKRINHENTKVGKHEKFLFFRVFVILCFRDKKVNSLSVKDLLLRNLALMTRQAIPVYRLYLPKYKLGNHRAIPGNSMTMPKPTIMTSTKGIIER